MRANTQKNNFAVFILTHWRPDNVITHKTLMAQKYKGKIYFIIDDEDKTGDEYIKRFWKENVIKFSKSEIANEFDEGDNFKDRRTIIYARNASFKIARDLGIRYFIQLDDDYTRFEYVFDNNEKFCHKVCYKLDKVFEYFLKYFQSINACSIALAQWGDFLGWGEWWFAYSVNRRRKCMNSFFCDTERPFKFFWKINEDVNTYTTLWQRGNLFLTIPNISLLQKATQSNSGWMTDIYLAGWTYKKSFYSVMMSPSCVKIAEMGSTHKRIHHKVKWNLATPKIIREIYKK